MDPRQAPATHVSWLVGIVIEAAIVLVALSRHPSARLGLGIPVPGVRIGEIVDTFPDS